MFFFRRSLVYLTLIAIFTFVLLASILETIRNRPLSGVTKTETTTTFDHIIFESTTDVKPTAIINFCESQLGNQVCKL